MKELDEFEFWRLNFPEHFSFHTSYLNSVDKYTSVKNVVQDRGLGTYTNLLGSEQNALIGLAGVFIENVREKDVERVGRFNQLKHIVDIYCRDYNLERRSVADMVKGVLSDFEGIGNGSYHIRTQRFLTLVKALRDKNVAMNVSLLVPPSLIDELDGCNAICRALTQGTQYEDDGDMGAFDMMWNTRNEVNKGCRSIMKRVEHFAEFGGVADFDDFRGEVLALLETFRK